MSETTQTPIERLGARLAELRDEKSRINERLKEVNDMESSLEAKMIDLLAQVGISSAVVPAIGKRFIVATKSHYSMPTRETPDARREIIRWVETHNSDMLTVNAQTFGKFVRELAEAGETIPPEIKVFKRPELRMESV